MRVKAVKLGFLGGMLRHPGDTFEIPDEPKGKDGNPVMFSNAKRKNGQPGWMEKIEEPERVPESKGAK